MSRLIFSCIILLVGEDVLIWLGKSPCNLQGSCVTASIVDKFAVNENVPPLGEIWVSYYFYHKYNLMDFCLKVKLYFEFFSRQICLKSLRASWTASRAFSTASPWVKVTKFVPERNLRFPSALARDRATSRCTH